MNRALRIVTGIVVIGVALVWGQSLRPRTYTLRMTGGDTLGRRHQLAEVLADEGKSLGLKITVVGTSGSNEALEKIRNRTLDMALAQGGLTPFPDVRQVAALNVEPLHLLVRQELANAGIAGLRGKRINLSTKGSGTRDLSTRVLRFAGMEPGKDARDEDRPYVQLENLSVSGLPDALFMVSTLPSPVATQLIARHNYRIVPLPFGTALSYRDAAIAPTVIPAYAYGAMPAVPPQDVPTLGTRLLLVAHKDVPGEAMRKVLETLLTTRYFRRVNLPPLSESDIVAVREMPLHPGTKAYLERNKPAITSEDIQGLDSLFGLLAALVGGTFLLQQWLRKRQLDGFDVYLKEVTALEKEAQTLENEAILDLNELMQIRARLSAIKTEALEKFTSGRLVNEELLSGFLTHVADVRNYLTALVLYERERLAEQAADSLPDDEQEARLRERWQTLGQGRTNPSANQQDAPTRQQRTPQAVFPATTTETRTDGEPGKVPATTTRQ